MTSVPPGPLPQPGSGDPDAPAARDEPVLPFTSGMLKALDGLDDQIHATKNIVHDAVEGADLMGIVDALELLTNLFEGIQPMVAAVNGRAAQIQEELVNRREAPARRVDSALAVLNDPARRVDSALVSLGIAHDGVEAVFHLLSVGRRELLLAAGDGREAGEQS